MKFWPLRDGPTMPAAVVYLALDLELKGCKFGRQGDRLIVSGPDGPPKLTEMERQQVQIWKPHLLALVDYCQVDRGKHLTKG